MQRIARPHRNRKRFKRALQDRCQLNERDPLNQDACFLPMRLLQAQSVEPGPDLILQQSARDQRPTPKAFRRHAIFGKKLPGLRRYRGRSPIRPIDLDLLRQFAERHDRLARNRVF